jgi:hypothetical protein
VTVPMRAPQSAILGEGNTQQRCEGFALRQEPLVPWEVPCSSGTRPDTVFAIYAFRNWVQPPHVSLNFGSAAGGSSAIRFAPWQSATASCCLSMLTSWRRLLSGK